MTVPGGSDQGQVAEVESQLWEIAPGEVLSSAGGRVPQQCHQVTPV